MQAVEHFVSVLLWFAAIQFVLMICTSPWYDLKNATQVLETNRRFLLSCCLCIGGFSGALVMVVTGHVWIGLIDALLLCIIFLIRRNLVEMMMLEKLLLAIIMVIGLRTL